MARMIRAVDDQIGSMTWEFQLHFGELDPLDIDQPPGDDVVCRTGHVAFASPGTHRHVAVRLEAWDGRPPPAEDPWRPIGEATFEAGTGIVRPAGLGALPGRELLIGPPHFEYGLTLWVRDVECVDLDPEGMPLEPAERWLLRFWPIRDVFDPIRHMPAMSSASPEAARPEPCSVAVPVSHAGDWPALRLSPSRETPTVVEETVWIVTQGYSSDVECSQEADRRGDEGADAGEDDEEVVDWPVPARLGKHADDYMRRMRELRRLQRLFPELVRYWDRVPADFGSWPGHQQRRFAGRLLDEERISRELNPDDRPVFTLTEDPRAPMYGAERGLSCRVWQWEPEGDGGAGRLSTHREIVARDVLAGRVLVTGIVTVLREERNVLRSYLVRNAEPVEAARVICAERTWGAGGPR